MKVNFVAISVGLVLAVLSVGCHSALLNTNSGVTFPLPIREDRPAFLFPISMAHLNAHGASSPIGEVVAASIIAKFGAMLISGQQLLDMVGDVSYELADTIDREVRRGTFMMSSSGRAAASSVADAMKRVIPQLVNLGLLKSPVAFKYIIVVHSHGEIDVSGTMLNVSNWGGVYDTESEQLVGYVNSFDTYANEERALDAELALAYDTIIEKLIRGAKK